MTERQAPAWATEQINLRDYMKWWIWKSVAQWKDWPYGGGHDEGLFTRTWPGFYMLTGDQTTYDFIDMLAHQFVDHPEVEACKCFLSDEDAATYPNTKRRPPYHGYPADQACLVHAPENYAWFLTHMCHINPSPKLLAALEDCAEHIGNWSKDVPDWYDWENHRFKAFIFGSKVVRDKPPYDFETMLAIRVLIVATNMYVLTGQQRYLDVSVDFADHWAKNIIEAPDEGILAMHADCPADEIPTRYGHLANRLNKERTRSGGEIANLMLDLMKYVDKPDYLIALRRLMEWSLEDRKLPGRGGPQEIMTLGKYRAFTGDTSLDAKIVEAAEPMIIEDDSRPALLLMCKASEQALNKPGLQYLRQYPDGRIVSDERDPATLALATQVSGDLKYLVHGMKVAGLRFLDSHYIWDGRELGCRGSWQGRNGVASHNVVPTLFTSALGGFTMILGECPWTEVKYTQPDGKPGLPEGLAALFMPTKANERKVRFYNDSDAPISLAVAAENTKLKFDKASVDGKPIQDPGKGLTVETGREAELVISLA